MRRAAPCARAVRRRSPPGSTHSSRAACRPASARRAARTAPSSSVRSCSSACSYCGHRQVQRRGDFLLRPARGRGGARSGGDRRVHVAAQAAQRARRPVEIAQRVEHRAVDAAAGERVERHAERRLVAAGGVDQAEHADADQVLDLDLRRQALRQPLRQGLDQRDVLASPARRASRVARPGRSRALRHLRRRDGGRGARGRQTQAARRRRRGPARRDASDPEAAARRRLRQVIDDRRAARAPIAHRAGRR